VPGALERYHALETTTYTEVVPFGIGFGFFIVVICKPVKQLVDVPLVSD
jgi:hypothetical protein